jgi:hypothetical protein
MEYRTAGNSLIAFGSTILLMSIASGIFLGSCTIDLLAPVVIVLGLRVSDASRRAAKWAIAVMALYLIATLLMIWLGTFHPDLVRVGNRILSPKLVPWALGTIAIFAIWSLVNIALLARSLRTVPRSGSI